MERVKVAGQSQIADFGLQISRFRIADQLPIADRRIAIHQSEIRN
jgi:hypothetical protein